MGAAGTPWLERSPWKGGVASSRGSKQLFAHWIGAVVWNALSIVVLFAVRQEGWTTQPPFIRAVLVGFLALGVLILAGALVQTARVRRFRDLRLELDPFPGSIGGQVGGSVDLPLRASVRLDARATLHCIRSYVGGSGKNRSRREDVVWSTAVVPEVQRAGTGVRLHFSFDVPDTDLPESGYADDDEEGDHHYWSVHLAAELPRADLDQSFRVPVYRVTPPLRASRSFRPTEPHRDGSGSGVEISRTAGGWRLDYGRSRYGVAGVGFLAFGVVTLSSGVFVVTAAGSLSGLLSGAVSVLFLVGFGLVGLLLLGAGLHMLLSRYTVEIGNGVVRSTRSYGIHRSTREARLEDLRRIEAKINMQSGQGSSAITTYKIQGSVRDGSTITLGDGIRGAYLLDRIRALLEEATGIAVEVTLRRGVSRS